MKNEEHLIALFIKKMYILYTAQFTHHKLRHHLCASISYRNTIINQSARVFSFSYFLNIFSININLLVVYRESVNLIGYITRRLSAVSITQLVD